MVRHREVVRPDVEHGATGSPAGDRQVGSMTTGEDERRSLGQVVEHHPDDEPRSLGAEHVDVVEHPHRRRRVGDERAEPWQHDGREVGRRQRDRLEVLAP